MQPEPKKHVSHAIAWSLVALFAGSLVFGIWMYSSQIDTIYSSSANLSVTHKKTTAKPTTATTGKTATSTTADWQTYTNLTYNYSIKYPKDWECKESATAHTNSAGKAYLSSNDCGPTTLKEDRLIGINVTDATLADVIADEKTSFQKNSTFKEQSTASIGSETATTLTFTNNTDKTIIPVVNLIEKPGKVFILSGEGSYVEDNILIKQILSTFTFTK